MFQRIPEISDNPKLVIKRWRAGQMSRIQIRRSRQIKMNSFVFHNPFIHPSNVTKLNILPLLKAKCKTAPKLKSLQYLHYSTQETQYLEENTAP